MELFYDLWRTCQISFLKSVAFTAPCCPSATVLKVRKMALLSVCEIIVAKSNQPPFIQLVLPHSREIEKCERTSSCSGCKGRDSFSSLYQQRINVFV